MTRGNEEMKKRTDTQQSWEQAGLSEGVTTNMYNQELHCVHYEGLQEKKALPMSPGSKVLIPNTACWCQTLHLLGTSYVLYTVNASLGLHRNLLQFHTHVMVSIVC